MPRLTHGTVTTIQQLQQARDQLASLSESVPLAFTLAVPNDVKDFGFMFEHLQADPANLLQEAPATAANLIALGVAMEDPAVGAPGDPGDSNIPAVYTYFGQFVDHDITMEAESGGLAIDATTTPMPLADIHSIIVNTRTATFDLDSLYGFPAPRDPADNNKMQLGVVSSFPGGRPPNKGDDNDVPRKPRNAADPKIDREALIGDPRNDENTIIAQMQVAFLKAHNVLVGQGLTFEQARTQLRQHYQHVVIHDFLRRICDPAVVDDILANGAKAFNPPDHLFFMPLEFSVAAYRFGHSMIRAQYNFNVFFQPASLDLLFTFTALTGQLGFGQGALTLPENWIIEWENFVDGAGPTGMARRIDPLLVEPLFRLRQETGAVRPDEARLAVRNLLRGYLLRMPTGQAVAGSLGLPVMSPAEIAAAAGNPEQVQALQDGGFLDRTPLWYYILAEAAHHGGNRMGPVGSTIVADVIIGLVKRSEDSIFAHPAWAPSMPSATPGTFILSDLLSFAGVLPAIPPVVPPPPPPPPPPGGSTYVVQPGDSLSSIAQNELGDASRWPEIFALNLHQIADPNLIFPGQVLNLPDNAPPPAPPRTYTVRAGDSLSLIAQNELGDANRWPEIFNLNQGLISDPNLIFPGQVLILPN